MMTTKTYSDEIYNCTNGAWFQVLYSFKYGDEPWEIDDECKTEIYADSAEDAITRFFIGDEAQGIRKKSDDFCNRVTNIKAYAK